MKKISIILCIALLSMSAFVTGRYSKSGIHGMVEPAEGAKRVWAISAKDSVSTIPVEGNFSLDVKPGTWTLVVESIKPFKNTVAENIIVQEGGSTDIGIIKLVSE